MPEFNTSGHAQGPAPRQLPVWLGRLVLLWLAGVFWLGCLAPAQAERVALVVGNSSYQNVAPLPNPRNDAEAIARELEGMDFEVFDGYDLTRSALEDLIRDFARNARDADAAVFYYAGHGLEVNSVNYLIPIDAAIQDETDLKFETININDILGFMEREQRTNLVFLDACRDNPMARNLSLSMGTRSVAIGRGLAPLDTGVGTLIAYSTQPGNVALDGEGSHSPFTQALLDHMGTPGLDVEIMMRNVRRDVMRTTAGQQVPWSSSSLTGSFVFQRFAVQPAPSQPETPVQPAALPAAEPPLGEDQAAETTPAPKTEAPPTATEEATGSAPALEGAALPRAEATPEAETLSPRELALRTQTALNRLGCKAGVEDGIWGKKSQAALERLGEHAPVELTALEPSLGILRQLDGLEGRICPLVCEVTEVMVDGACERKTCAEGQRLSSRGQCYTPKATARRSTPTKRKSSCFTYNGQTYCD